jgi:ribose transport system substrate-binding protein
MLSKLFGIAAAILLGGALILSGCSKSEEGTGSTATTQSSGSKALNLAFVTNNASDFWTIARAGCNKAMEEMPNVKVDFQIPSAGTAADQKRIVDDLLTRGTDGMAISPVDPENETPMLNQVAKQTLVFCHDSDAPKSDRACYVGTNNVDAGKQAGDLVKQALPNGGKIMVFVGKRDAQNAKERYQGLEESLKGSNVQILDVRTDDVDRARAKSNVQETLVNYPDIAGLVGLWSYNGPAIYNVVKEANKIGQIKIVCFDEEDDTLAGVKAGGIYATVVQQPYEFGHMSITLMAKYLQGDKSVIPPTKQIFIPTLAITQDKVDAFKENLDKLRGRK